MQKKRGFTMIELIIVIFTLGIIIWFARNFLNTTRQERVIFWETCVNYIFWEIEKIQSDIDYERNTKLLINNGSSLITPDFFAFRYNGFKNTTNWSGQIAIQGIIVSGGAIQSQKTYTDLQLTSNQIPQLCKNSRFAVVVNTGLDIIIPTKEIDPDTNWYIWSQGNDYILNTNTVWQITGEALFYACDSSTLWTIKNCIEIAKMYADKRSKKFYYWKCIKVSSNDWSCQSRPTIN